MSHKQGAQSLLPYLNSENEDTHNKRLSRYMERISPHKEAISASPLGIVVHSLIMNRLRKKADEEDLRNKETQRKLFDQYQDRRFNEKAYLKKLAHELEIAKEDRHNKRDLEKEKRQHDYDLQKTLQNAKISDAFKQKDEGRKAIQGSFSDPGEALKYMLNPEEMEKKREVFDASGIGHKVWGKVKEAFGGDKYQPKKIRSRLKE